MLVAVWSAELCGCGHGQPEQQQRPVRAGGRWRGVGGPPGAHPHAQRGHRPAAGGGGGAGGGAPPTHAAHLLHPSHRAAQQGDKLIF